jgi:N-dimethylarginine dimethylaminohydrolase
MAGKGIANEWGAIQRVVVGTAESMGAAPALEACYDPTSRHHIAASSYPVEADVQRELDGLAQILQEVGAEVIRPQVIEGLIQVFARDIGMVVDDVLLRARTISERAGEWDGLTDALAGLHAENLPEGVRLEGGDLLVLDGALAVGVTPDNQLSGLKTARSNASAVAFLKERFPSREVLPIALSKDDIDPRACTLHLDCAFMPLGGGHAIVNSGAFLRPDELEALLEIHGSAGVLDVDAQQAMLLQTNLFNLGPTTVLSDARFEHVNSALRNWGYQVLTTKMEHVGRMGGLLRCTTFPLLRL